MNRRNLALGLVASGGALAVAGIAVIYWPAGLIVGGVALVAVGLVGVEL